MDLFGRIKARFNEARASILRVLLAFVCGTAVGWYYKAELLAKTCQPLAADLAAAWPGSVSQTPALHFSTSASMFLAYLQIAVAFGFFTALPFLLREIWVFISSGAHSHARRLVAPFVATSCAVIAPLSWCCWQLWFPRAFRNLLSFPIVNMTGLTIAPAVLVADYVEFVTRSLFGVALAAAIPVLLSFLSYAGIAKHRELMRFFRYFVVLAFVVAALATPPDPFSLILVASFLCAVYGLSIGLARSVGKLRPH